MNAVFDVVSLRLLVWFVREIMTVFHCYCYLQLLCEFTFLFTVKLFIYCSFMKGTCVHRDSDNHLLMDRGGTMNPI